MDLYVIYRIYNDKTFDILGVVDSEEKATEFAREAYYKVGADSEVYYEEFVLNEISPL